MADFRLLHRLDQVPYIPVFDRNSSKNSIGRRAAIVSAFVDEQEVRHSLPYYTAVGQAALEETGATSARQMGLVMKAAQARLAGKRVDGKALSDSVRARLA
jgi:uncharacterized protein YqeY